MTPEVIVKFNSFTIGWVRHSDTQKQLCLCVQDQTNQGSFFKH
jgi:hypothetical protein